jgi:hypothetical protein
MNTGFTILSGQTVPSNYSWDIDVPFTNASALISGVVVGTNEIISPSEVQALTGSIFGYAPGLKVFFSNNSSNDYSYNVTEKYEWNFGDYYNSVNNEAILFNCNIPVEHTYIMPGQYTVTLTHTRTETPTIVDPALRLCQGYHGYQWYWNNLGEGLAQSVTWDDLLPDKPLNKTWNDESACFDKHCSYWSWTELKSEGTNPFKWEDLKIAGTKPKQWVNQGNGTDACSNTNIVLVDKVQTTSYTLVKQIDVAEIPPIAGIAAVNPNGSLTNVASGTSPYPVRLTARTTIPGSFPIDRIDWNFGDGSPTVTVGRYSTPDPSIFIKNNQITDDPVDPRNYDALVTYKRNFRQYNLFYPSLTAYAISTGTYDAVSFFVGPINIPKLKNSSDTKIKILKVRNTKKGNLYTLDVNGNITFATTNLSAANLIPDVEVHTPSNPIRDSVTVQYVSNGNPGSDYPSTYVPTCTPPEIINIAVEEIYLVQEEDSSPIYNESGEYIYV